MNGTLPQIQGGVSGTNSLETELSSRQGLAAFRFPFILENWFTVQVYINWKDVTEFSIFLPDI